MTPQPSDAVRISPDDLAARIRSSGNLGITATQLVHTTGADRSEVVASLDLLARQRRVARVGHGLWIDPALLRDPSAGAGFSAPDEYLTKFARSYRLRVDAFDQEIQFRPNTNEPVHRWWPYVQGFSAGFVREVLRRHRVGPGATVLDPFAGSGTVPVAARMAGARSIGVELMPISAFVARAKQAWDVDPAALRRSAAALLRVARAGPMGPLPFLRETRRQFAPGPLGSLRRIRRALDADDAPPGERTLLRLAFARILVESSRMRRSPCLGYGPKPPVPASAPYRRFEEAVERIAEDLAGLADGSERPGPAAEILERDARDLRVPEGSVDLAVTSPPYVNGMDYVMNYKIELAWLGLANSYEDLRALKDRMIACDNLPRASAGRGWSDAQLRRDRWMIEILRRMRANLRAKSTYRRDDMDAIVASYFADLRPTISGVFRSLRAGGRFVVVNGDSFLAGVYVPGDLVFGRLAAQAGFEVERFERARVRRSGQRRDLELRESILTLRKPTA